MDANRFEHLVADVMDALPSRVTRELDNVAFCVEPRSPNGRTLGEYVGIPRSVRSEFEVAPLPDKIVLYLRDIVGQTDGTAAAVAEEIRRVLLHEIGHHLGWGDGVLEEIERERGWR